MQEVYVYKKGEEVFLSSDDESNATLLGCIETPLNFETYNNLYLEFGLTESMRILLNSIK